MLETDGRVNILGLTRPAFEAVAGRGGQSRALGRLYRLAFAEGRFEPGSEAIGRKTAADLTARVTLRIPDRRARRRGRGALRDDGQGPPQAR